MRYRNTKTGNVIDVSSVIHSENWVEVEEVKQSSSTKQKKTRGKKNE